MTARELKKCMLEIIAWYNESIVDGDSCKEAAEVLSSMIFDFSFREHNIDKKRLRRLIEIDAPINFIECLSYEPEDMSGEWQGHKYQLAFDFDDILVIETNDFRKDIPYLCETELELNDCIDCIMNEFYN